MSYLGSLSAADERLDVFLAAGWITKGQHRAALAFVSDEAEARSRARRTPKRLQGRQAEGFSIVPKAAERYRKACSAMGGLADLCVKLVIQGYTTAELATETCSTEEDVKALFRQALRWLQAYYEFDEAQT